MNTHSKEKLKEDISNIQQEKSEFAYTGSDMHPNAQSNIDGRTIIGDEEIQQLEEPPI